MVRLLMLLALFVALPSPATAQGTAQGTRYDPAADYVTAGQDEPGYQRWMKQASWRPMYVRAFNNYLVTNGVGGVAPIWQLLRTATDWQRCAADPFEVPPTSEWANIVATLRYVGDTVVPAIGPVEPVSVYRNPALNACAGGAQASTHREMGAVDVVPLRPTSREALMLDLCSVHLANADRPIGLGFYKGLRFHIDSRKFREWGTAGANGGYGCTSVLAAAGRPIPAPFISAPSPAPVQAGVTLAGSAPARSVQPALAPPAPRDPLAPIEPVRTP